MEEYEDLILEITALVLKANKVTNHHFFVDFIGHVDSVQVYYLENGYKKGIDNKIYLLSVYARCIDLKKQLEKCKDNLARLILETKKEPYAKVQ